MEGTVLRFNCTTTSFFHTSRKERANLLKSAPFIFGSTFRGAVLDYLLRTLCKQERQDRLQVMNEPKLIADFHQQCPEPCPLKSCFNENPLIWFSFGIFEEPDYATVTRIGLARDTRSVAEGSIFNMEAIAPGSSFQFRIILFDQVREFAGLITEAVQCAGSIQGVGRARSIGFGRFDVLSQPPMDFESLVTERIGELPAAAGRLEMTFTTPLVLGEPTEPTPVRTDRLGEYISVEIRKVASAIRGREFQSMVVRPSDARIHPEFVGRFSYERGLRENRLVAWPGSSVMLKIEGERDTNQLAVASVLGIGPWNDWGFGQFFLLSEK